MIGSSVILVFLLVEMVVASLLILPIPAVVLNALLGFLDLIWKKDIRTRIAIITLFTLCSLLFMNAFLEERHVRGKLRNPTSSHIQHDLYHRLSSSQTTAYLTGFTLFITLIIWRFRAILSNMLALQQEIAAHAQPKNAEGLSSQNQGQDSFDKILAENAELQKKVEAAETEYNNATKEIAKAGALRSQIESTERAYRELLEKQPSKEDGDKKVD